MEQVRPKRRKHHIIYKTTCLTTGKWYIGLHSTDDLNDGYMGSGSHLWKSIKRYGKHNHRTEILEHCPDRTSLIKREAEIVTQDLLQQEACMNLMLGGGAGPEFKKPTKEETRARISQRSKEMWAKRKAEGYVPPPQSPEHVAKRAKSNTGKIRTTEQKVNLKRGQQLYFSSVDRAVLNERGQKAAVTRQERGTNKGGRPPGIPLSDEQRQHLAVINAGKTWPRACCICCRKETTLSALNRYHTSCSTS